ncbi:MAG TPA: hypothetical protein VND62_06735 [Acidimicrobiales bacterium]|nr:hypothetical protein [Acidimicrobiales bacterium]
MRLPKFSKKVMAIGAAAGIAMGAAGIAAAYFPTTGSGSGTATASIQGVKLAVNGTATVPVGTTIHVHINAYNPNHAKATIGDVTLTNLEPVKVTCPPGSFTTTAASNPLLVTAGPGSFNYTTTTVTPTITLNTITGQTQASCLTGVTFTITS